MARMGIFNRNDTTPESVPRSVQLLSYRHTFDTKYMQIVPNYVQYLYPNESLSLKVTNLVKSIPLVTPQLSQIRVVQRFVAVPLRLLWFAWEDYIKGENDSNFVYEEPYLVNSIASESATSFASNLYRPWGFRFVNASGTEVRFIPRSFVAESNNYAPQTLYGKFSFGSKCAYAQFGSHELGDYFGAPLYVPFGKCSDEFKTAVNGSDNVFSAFPFAAYQLAYSYFYRSPNVQTRIDDYYEMQNLTEETGEHEYTKGVAEIHQVNTSVPIKYATVNLSDEALETGMSGFNRDMAMDNTAIGAWLTSWDKVEHFPLKSGANWSMLACRPNSTSGLPEYRPSNICLFRKRYANWQSDNFTCCNPWQQRGDEVQIPVNGTVEASIGDFTVSVVPRGTITSTFTGEAKQIPVTVGTVFDSSLAESFGGLRVYESESRGFLGTSVPPLGTVPARLSGETDEFVPKGTITSVFNGTTSTGAGVGSVSVSQNNLYVSPSSLKFALALQHVKELQAQIDNRYQSYIKKFFGAYAQDFRLDRPEFIGGMVQDLNVAQVIQNSESTSDSPLGTQAGLATSAKTSGRIRYHAQEHTIVLGLIHIIPDSEYIGGLDREFNTQDRFDWMLPNFSHVAEQPVRNSELALSPYGRENIVGWNPVDKTSSVTMNGAFGYEPVYNYLRWKRSIATGAFRDTLNSRGSYEYYKPWLITRDFGFTFDSTQSNGHVKVNSPTLTDKFLSGRYGVDNSNFVVTDNEVMYPFMCDSYFDVRMVRTIPSRGLPSKI